jgi:hypothetical protein
MTLIETVGRILAPEYYEVDSTVFATALRKVEAIAEEVIIAVLQAEPAEVQKFISGVSLFSPRPPIRVEEEANTTLKFGSYHDEAKIMNSWN